LLRSLRSACSARRERLPEPLASSLRARNAALQAVAGELQRKNRLNAKVAQNLQMHICGIFAEVASGAQPAPVYGPSGRQNAAGSQKWLDAVG
jgi:hypothetical protein